MAQYDEAAVRRRLTADLEQIQRDIYERTQGEQAVTPSMESSDGSGISSEQADEASAVAEYDRNQAMLENDRALLRKIESALERLDAGKYGVCERCGKPINPRRLDALPYVTLDVECQAIVERAV
jgi:RNA polymerase-binding protein DksA